MHSHLFVIVGDNDVNSISVEEIYNNYKKFEEAIWPTKVRFCGHLRRKDFDLKKVERNNLFLYQKLGKKYKSPRIVKKKDFGNRPRYHFHLYGEGYRHLGVLILSALKDFAKYW